MTTSGKLRVGLIGANVNEGWGGRVHAQALRALPEYELVAVGTAHRETADEAARVLGARYAFDNFEELVTCPDVDVVTVAVRVPFHQEMVEAALNAGKHVFCEWPLAANLKEAESMTALAKEKGLKNVVGLQGRADPILAQLKKLIERGYVGDVLACHLKVINGGILERELRRSWQVDPSLGAHVLTIPAGHSIDSMCFAVGDFDRISANLATQTKEWKVRETGDVVETRSPDHVLFSGQLEGGAIASVHVALVPYHGSGLTLEIYGTEGTIAASASGSPQTGGLRLRGARGTDASLADIPLEEDTEPVAEEIRNTPSANVARLYSRLAGGILRDEEITPDFETGLRLHRLIDAIEVSSRDGARVDVG